MAALSADDEESILRLPYKITYSSNLEVCTLRRSVPAPGIFLLTALLITGIAQPLWAHAILMESKPKANATVTGSELPIWLRFNVRVDGGRSRLQLIGPDGSAVSLEAAKQTAPNILESRATGLKSGAYKLHWQVLASDGHISRGEVDFTVN
jgi:methionine-rich copper-binding protein CopC